MHYGSSIRNWLPLFLIALLCVLFYYPVLFYGKTQIHAEGVSLGVALMHILGSALHGDSSMLWTTSIYGGHPIFAEGQGGFANPLHLLFAWFFQPVTGYNLHQFLSALLSGVGAYGMCRSSGCSRAASVFATLAILFSTLWIGGRSNLAVGSTLGWIPWALWAMNLWLKTASLASACFFGTAMALMVLSGYPQLVHGVLIYITVYVAVQLVSGGENTACRSHRWRLLSTLGIAVGLCVGLSAVQWLPLLELASESHRSAGVSIATVDDASPAAFLRGFLYTFSNPDELPSVRAGSAAMHFDAFGSLVVCLVVSLLIFCRFTSRATGHLSATILMVVLGLGVRGSPLFQILYDYHLIPGLHNFRLAFTYLYIALVGFALLAAIALDSLARTAPALGQAGVLCRRFSFSMWQIFKFAIWALIWFYAIFSLHMEGVPDGQYYFALLWLLCFGSALLLRLQRYLPVIAVVILTAEIIAYRIDAYEYGDASLISKPESIRVLQQAPDLQEFKFYDGTFAAVYSFLPANSPGVVKGLQVMLASVTPAANALWEVSSLKGNLALGLQRRTLADPIIEAELGQRDGDVGTPGLRLIDFSSLKYVSVSPSFELQGFVDAYTDSVLPVRIVENSYAYPRFQFFDSVIFVPNVEAAVETVQSLKSRTLIVEADHLPVSMDVQRNSATESTFVLLKDSANDYVFEINVPAPVWFFMADANYPGWNAYLNGARTELYSAQLLGKAVYLPAGNHTLRVVFEPMSFRIGLGVTVLSSCVLLLVCLNILTCRKKPIRIGAV